MDNPDNSYENLIFSEKALERAYLGQHPQYKEPEKEQQPLTKKEQKVYNYIKTHPNYTMPEVCRVFSICQAEYIQIKRTIAKKGYKIGGTIAQPISDLWQLTDWEEEAHTLKKATERARENIAYEKRLRRRFNAGETIRGYDVYKCRICGKLRTTKNGRTICFECERARKK